MPSELSAAALHPSGRPAANAASMAPLFSLLYESRAKRPISDDGLEQLVGAAQSRNRREGVTGLLIYDEGRFLQWLEGPADGVERVWNSIRRDRRHGDITVLGESVTPARCFGHSPMDLRRRRGKPGRTPTSAPQMMADQFTLCALVDDVVVPELLARHDTPVLPVVDPHAAELARLLLAADPKAAFALVDELRAQGRSLGQLSAGLLEPAARALGDIWLADDCSEVDVTLGMGHLQRALRQAGACSLPADGTRPPLSVPRHVLLAPPPQERHLLGSVIASELFWHAGWSVSCEFPGTDEALSEAVHAHWFDVLDLSLSSAFTREHRLPAMAASVRAARAGSLNPGLIVIVDGRVFFERPSAFEEVGADAGSASALDLVSTALDRCSRAGTSP